ncbi:hypothetical protein FKM82_006836 [Ascaphus truei]
MATLNPPFHCSNMLSLATKIVEAMYAPVPEGIYSDKVTNTIRRCLTSDSELRPDIVEVCSIISDVMMKYVDGLSSCQLAIEKKLERERKRAQKYFVEANKNAVIYSHLATKPHVRYEKSSVSSSSSGVASCKSDFSESTIIPIGMFQSDNRVKESDEIFPDDNYCVDNTEKDVFSTLDDDLDISDNSSCSSLSYFKGCSIVSGTLKRSVSVPGGEKQPQARERTGSTGCKPRPASAGIAVSQKKVRQISDPIQQILIQLHKIIYITQLPPALHDNLKRRVIERFKKSLFSLQSNPCNLKAEIKKVLQGSPELIEPNFFTADCHVLLQSLGGKSLIINDRTGNPSSFEFEEGITYEQMQTLIEEVLEDSGYYNLPSNRYHSYPWGVRNLLTIKR